MRATIASLSNIAVDYLVTGYGRGEKIEGKVYKSHHKNVKLF